MLGPKQQGSFTIKEPFICHLADFGPEYGGSFIDSLLLLAGHCRTQMGVETMCILPEWPQERRWLKKLDEAGVRCRFAPRTRNIMFQAREQLRDLNPIVLHTHFFLFNVSAVLLKLMFNWHPKVVWHYHNPVEPTLLQRSKNVIKIGLLGQYLVDRFIAVGDVVYQSLINSGLPRDKLALIYNGVNTSKFSPNAHLRRAMRESLGIAMDQTVFLLLGWDPIRKGVDVFVRAAEDVVTGSRNDCCFIVVGRKETKEFVSSLPLFSRLNSFLRVIDPIEDFSLLLNAVDILVSASRSEGFSYSILEAMAAKRLILSSNLPGTGETYGKADGVWLFNTENSTELADLMRRAIRLTSIERHSLGTANAEFVYRYYSLDVWADKIVNLYTLLSKS